MNKHKYPLVTVFLIILQLCNSAKSMEESFLNEIDAEYYSLEQCVLNCLNNENETVISTAQSLKVPTKTVLDIYKRSNEIVGPVVNAINNNIISKDKLQTLINNTNYIMNTNITMSDIENIAYKSDNLANIIDCLDIDVSKYNLKEQDVLDYLNRDNENMNISNTALKMNLPNMIVLEIYLKSSTLIMEVYREINKQYYNKTLNTSDFWQSLCHFDNKSHTDNDNFEKFDDSSCIDTNNSENYINNILYKLEKPLLTN